MSTRVPLAGFVLGLVALFGGSFAAGSAIDSIRDVKSPDETHEMPDGHR